jgi:CMP-N,N'-diacetyllegionaminic acid synthase
LTLNGILITSVHIAMNHYKLEVRQSTIFSTNVTACGVLTKLDSTFVTSSYFGMNHYGFTRGIRGGNMNCIALIPARSGSKRLPNKNVKILGGHPLIAHTIRAAQDSGIFRGVFVSTDSPEYADIAEYYGAYSILRPAEFAADSSPDAEWVKHALDYVSDWALVDYFAILRPTSPFRSGAAIKAAWDNYETGYWLKMVEPVKQHPFKTWFVEGKIMMYTVNLPTWEKGHALPTQELPPIYVQAGALEIRPVGNIEPDKYQAFVVDDFNGYDINDEKDWVYAEWLLAHNRVKLPIIDKPPYKSNTIWEEPNVS